MRWWCHSRLVRAVATVILLWTAADLTNVSLCAHDSDELGSSVAVGLTATLRGETTNEAPQPAPHIDDCFCCSHCVNVPTVVPPVFAEPTARREAPLDVAVPYGFGFPLYHPPLV
jgi:hypothetical protein